jgi:hypothetical protein
MRREYVEYWRTHNASCVGLSRIGRGRWYALYSDSTSRKTSWIWTVFPDKMITYDNKGIKLTWNKLKP